MITNTSSGLSSLGLLGTSSTFTKPVASKLKVRIALKRLFSTDESWWFHWWRLTITDLKMTMMTFLPRKWAWSCKGLCPPPCPLSSLSTPGQGSTLFLGWPLWRSLSTCGRSNNNGWRSPYSSRNRQSSLPSARGWSVHLAARQCQHLLWNHFWWTAFNDRYLRCWMRLKAPLGCKSRSTFALE